MPASEMKRKPPGWNFRCLLVSLARSLSHEEVTEMISYLVGAKLLTLTETESINSAIELFTVLCDKQYLNSTSLETLKMMLMALNREELIFKALEYAHNTKDEEICQDRVPSEEDIDEGHGFIIFVLTPVKCLTEKYLDEFKTMASSLLFAPIAHISVVGIQTKDTATTVTVMVRDVYLSVLETQLRDNKVRAKDLQDVTSVSIRGKTYQLELRDPESLKVALAPECQAVEERTRLEEKEAELHEREKRLDDREKALEARAKGEEDNLQNERVKKLSQKGGMSVTLWKVFGKLDEKKMYPETTQDELNRQCLHAKVRRLYPQLGQKYGSSAEIKRQVGNHP